MRFPHVLKQPILMTQTEASDVTHIVHQPLSLIQAEAILGQSVKLIHLYHDGTQEGDEKIRLWLET